MVRFKNRYIVIEVNPTDAKSKNCPLHLKPATLYVSILKKVQQVHGDFGVAAVKSGLVAKYCNKWTRIAMIRVRHGAHRLVTSCLPLLKELEKQNVVVNILYLGATLRQCYKFIKQHQRKCLEKLWSRLESQDLRTTMESALMDFSALETIGNKSASETKEVGPVTV